MGYVKNYQEQVRLSGSKTITVPYPASKEGGVKNVTVEYEEEVPIDITIEMDTDSFDQSLHNYSEEFGLLSKSVSNAQSAGTASKQQLSRQVEKNILNGFFSVIRHEVSTQMMGLMEKIENSFKLLQELVISCSNKKEEIETKLNNIRKIYSGRLNDLNKELKNRTSHSLSQAVSWKKENDEEKRRWFSNEGPGTFTVTAAEIAALQAAESVCKLKDKAEETIQKANRFLQFQRELELVDYIRKTGKEEAAVYFIPVCFMQTDNQNNRIEKEIFYSSSIPLSKEEVNIKLIDPFSKCMSWEKLPIEKQGSIGAFFNAELDKLQQNSGGREIRIKELMKKMINLHSITTNV